MSERKYSCVYFISTMYMMLVSLSAIVANKLIGTPLGMFSAASLISPIWFMLGDIIAEVYGYRMSRNLFWSVICCQLLFALSCYLIIKLPSPVFWHGQDSYELVTGHLFRIALFALVGSIIAWKINIFLLMRWKILLHGKYFWLRSLGSSAIGEIIFSILSITLSIIGMFPLGQVISIIVWSCLLKILGLIILAPIANYIVVLLQHLEGEIKADCIVNFNPFR